MPTTIENLKEAFAGESQANQKYRAIARKRAREIPNIAKLFNTAAEAETITRKDILCFDGIASTVENLKAAIAGENYEYTKSIRQCLSKQRKIITKPKRMFKYAVGAEDVHAQLYKIALAAAEKGRDLEETEFYLCPVCGHIEFGKPKNNCPICGTLASKYIKIA